MIKIKIIQSPDQLICSELTFFKNSISIGNTNNDINIDDKKIFSNHLNIEITKENKMIIEPTSNVDHFYIEQKITKTKSYLQIGQEVTIGDTRFIVLVFEFEDIANIKTLRDEKLKKLETTDPAKWKVLDYIHKNPL